MAVALSVRTLHVPACPGDHPVIPGNQEPEGGSLPPGPAGAPSGKAARRLPALWVMYIFHTSLRIKNHKDLI